MKKIEILINAFEKALRNSYEWGEIDLEDFEELTEIERITLFRAFLEENMYYTFIFDQEFAKSLWGDEKHMAFYAGYEEWANADRKEEDSDGFDEVQHDRMPLWEYHLMMMARSTDRLKYLEENS